MASMVAGGLFNAIAFAGAGFLFKSLDGSNYGDEMKRHNLAIENLARAKEAWNENEIRQRDKIQRLRLELSDANRDINDTNKALDLLRKVQSVRFQDRVFTREPRLNDYYTPSAEMQKYQSIAVGTMGLGAGWVGYKLYLLI